MSVKKLICFHNMVAPYRVPFFEALDKLPGWRTKVYFTSQREPNRDWPVPSLPFDVAFLSSSVIRWRETYLHIARGVPESLDREKPDVVLVSGMGPASTAAARWAECNDVPCILWWGGHPLAKSSSSLLRRSWRKHFLGYCSFALTYSRAGANYLISLGLKPQRVLPIGNATFDVSRFRADIDSLRASSAEQVKAVVQNKPFGLFVGQLIPRKNVLVLPDILRNVLEIFTDFCIVVIGDGSLRSTLAQRAREVGVDHRLRMLGNLPREEVFPFYAFAQMLIHPTLFDSWAQVVNEAAASGLPIVTTPYEGSVGDLLREGESALVRSPDAFSLASAIVDLLRNDSLKRSLGLRAIEALKEQDLDDAICRIGGVLAELTSHDAGNFGDSN